jgi:hypothetical protein
VPTLRAISLLILAAGCAVPDSGAGARYVGGTLAALAAGAEGRLNISDDLFLEFRAPKRQINVAWERINLVEYGQNVSRRLGLAMAISPLFLLSKSRQHFLTVGYTDAAGRQQAMVFRIEKSQIRPVLVALEARTGLKVTYQDEQARKSGRG